MSTRPSVVFLYDLDLIYSNHRSLNGLEKRDSTQSHPTEHSFTSVLRLISLNILNHLTPKQANVQWAYRFYSSSYYKHTHKAGFQDLSEHSLEEFEENLNVCYEQHTSNGTPSSSGMSKAGVLGRTLQDIATDFNWKTPTDSLTPTRRGRRNAKLPVEQNLHNLVFIFTDVPADESISLFCNLNGNFSNLSPKTVMDCILTKDLLKKFNEFQLSLNFVDLSTDSKKSFISKIASDLRGAVINSLALISSFSFSHIFQAARAIEQSSKDFCSSCQQLQLRPKFSIHIANIIVEVDVQCWNSNCSGSSPSLRYDDAHVPTLTCIPVFQGAVPNATLLCYDGLYLLSANGSIIEQEAQDRILWIGQWNEHLFVILPQNSSVASMVFPSSPWSLAFLKSKLVEAIESKPVSTNQNLEVQSFVEKLVAGTDISESVEPSTDSAVTRSQWGRLLQIKSNYADRKMSHFGTHWERLKDCFQLDTFHKEEVDHVRSSMDNCQQIERPKSSDTFPAISSDAIKMKIGNTRIQNLRASQLLQKSQEVRARNDEIEREKLNKEKQAADEKREKKWKEVEAYIVVLRRSVAAEDFIRTVMDEEKPLDKVQVLERLMEVKKEAYDSPVEEWQLFCLAQVIATTMLYIWREPNAQNFELGYDTLSTHFLRTPASIGRTVSKENKVHEYKFQILLRLELCWMVPSLANEEEILQETATLLQLLSINCPKAMSSFFQDTLVIHFENMLPDLLVSLAEEMNQTIPASLSELVSNLNARGTPSPAMSSGLPSVHSANSHQDAGGSQRPTTRELRSRTLSRQPSINILQHKKQIALPNKSEKPSAAAAVANGPSQSKKEEPSEVGRVRRSLQFGMDTPVKGGKSKSPNKLATPKRNSNQLGVSTLSFPEFTTPSKTNDLILAPETPSRLRSGGKSVRKTDGIHVVVESPEVKQEAVRSSPRRLQAAMALRRRASFYSSLNSADVSTAGSSRHWSRAESQVWSEKAKASAALATEDGNGPKPGHSAQFLFSRILSRNESDSNQTDALALSTPLKDIPELAELASCSTWIPPAFNAEKDVQPPANLPSTPSKISGPGTYNMAADATGNLLPFPTADLPVFAIPNGGATPTKTPMKTPLKTPRHVQFDLSFQPATPSSKTVPCARSILKSPMPVAPSPFRNKTPLKVADNFQPAVAQSERKAGLHVLDETSFDDAHELDLLSPAKVDQERKASYTPPDRQDDVVQKLDERTLLPEDEVQLQSPVKPAAKSTVSPLILRRSSRNTVHSSNMMRSDPNWTVVDYKRLNSADGTKPASAGRRSRLQAMKQSNQVDQSDDPYEFTNEEENTSSLCQRSYGPDTSSHKRKLFQSGCDKVSSNKKRKLMQQSPPTSEKAAISSPSLRKFQPPLNSSLFHLENSPLLNTLDTKINV